MKSFHGFLNETSTGHKMGLKFNRAIIYSFQLDCYTHVRAVNEIAGLLPNSHIVGTFIVWTSIKFGHSTDRLRPSVPGTSLGRNKGVHSSPLILARFSWYNLHYPHPSVTRQSLFIGKRLPLLSAGF